MGTYRGYQEKEEVVVVEEKEKNDAKRWMEPWELGRWGWKGDVTFRTFCPVGWLVVRRGPLSEAGSRRNPAPREGAPGGPGSVTRTGRGADDSRVGRRTSRTLGLRLLPGPHHFPAVGVCPVRSFTLS